MLAHGIARGAGIGKPDRFGAAAAARRSHNLLICPPSPAASSAEQVALIAPLRPACEPVLTCRSRFGEIPPFCDSDHRRGVGSV